MLCQAPFLTPLHKPRQNPQPCVVPELLAQTSFQTPCQLSCIPQEQNKVCAKIFVDSPHACVAANAFAHNCSQTPSKTHFSPQEKNKVRAKMFVDGRLNPDMVGQSAYGLGKLFGVKVGKHYKVGVL